MKYALVTGASSGIGAAIARELAAKGYGLLLVARNATALQQLAAQLQAAYGIEAHSLPYDLSAPQSVQELAGQVLANNWPLQVLVNNAGYTIWDHFAASDAQALREMAEVNIMAVTGLCHALIPVLRQQQPAHILNVSSTTAYQGLPYMAVYAASKAFVLSFSRALRHELKSEGIHVSCLVPGSTESAFMVRADMQPLEAAAAPVLMTSEAVAKAGVKGMFRREKEIVPGIINKLNRIVAHIGGKSALEAGAAGLYGKNLARKSTKPPEELS